MIERVLHSVVSAQVAAIVADPSLLDGIFQPEGSAARVSDAELATIKANFAARTPRVRHGYVSDHADIPCFTILLASDEPDTQFLSNLAQMDDDNPAIPVEGVIESRRYDLLVLARSPDEAYWNYKILKAAMFSARAALQAADVDLMKYSGRELEPATENLPAIVFRRLLSVSLIVEEYVSLPALPRYTGGVEILRDTVGGGVVPVGAWR